MRGEKRTERLDVPRQLRVQGSLRLLVLRLAELGNRSPGMQVLEMLTKGAEQIRREGGKEVEAVFSQVLSGSVR